ncbi:MAG: hypothetical protein K0R73_1158 [Candidatus Midichloriaceae bacterium]|jgi:hypothetical protein|nr:hypothetical protein [Candidatus Midichloriaceae bacterium]
MLDNYERLATKMIEELSPEIRGEIETPILNLVSRLYTASLQYHSNAVATNVRAASDILTNFPNVYVEQRKPELLSKEILRCGRLEIFQHLIAQGSSYLNPKVIDYICKSSLYELEAEGLKDTTHLSFTFYESHEIKPKLHENNVAHKKELLDFVINNIAKEDLADLRKSCEKIPEEEVKEHALKLITKKEALLALDEGFKYGNILNYCSASYTLMEKGTMPKLLGGAALLVGAGAAFIYINNLQSACQNIIGLIKQSLEKSGLERS